MWDRAQPKRKRTLTRPLSSLLRAAPRRTPAKAATAPSPRGADFDFATLPLFPAKTSLPRAGGDEHAVKVNAPPKKSKHDKHDKADNDKPVKHDKADKHDKPVKHDEPVKAAPACDAPTSMNAVISGSFLDGLSMDDYYPDLAGKGWYAHGGTAGTWDTGTRCGANAQLVGSIGVSCQPEKFELEQTVTHTKSIFDGKADSDNGTTHDDIADSGRDYKKAPARQEHKSGVPEATVHAKGKTPPQELHISMADPPSLLYGSVGNAEWDRTFVTTLKGPNGSKSATWSTSIAIKDKKVVKNAIKK